MKFRNTEIFSFLKKCENKDGSAIKSVYLHYILKQLNERKNRNISFEGEYSRGFA